jgi:hypothetical protein
MYLLVTTRARNNLNSSGESTLDQVADLLNLGGICKHHWIFIIAADSNVRPWHQCELVIGPYMIVPPLASGYVGSD